MNHTKRKTALVIVVISFILLSLIKGSLLFLFNALFIILALFIGYKLISCLIKEFKGRNLRDRFFLVLTILGYLILFFIMSVYCRGA